MPTTYAHDLFGKLVSQRLDKKAQEMLNKHKNQFAIGLHGPDILFYVHPFCTNRVNRVGYTMHQQTAEEFFKKGRALYQQTKDEALLAYLSGFVCHFMLDSSCHPFIGKYIDKTGAPHDEIETEFDRALMEQTGKNPFRYHPACVIHGERESIRVISSVLDGIAEKDVRQALWGMKLYTGITVCKGPLKRNFMLGVGKVAGIYDLVQGRIIRRQPVERCLQSTQELKRLFKLAVPETVTVLDEFLKNIESTGELNPRFNRNYN